MPSSVPLSYLLPPLQRFDCRWRNRSQTWPWKSLAPSDWAVASHPSRPETPASPSPGTWSALRTRTMVTSRLRRTESGSACSPSAMTPSSAMETAAPETRWGQIPACSLRERPRSCTAWPFRERGRQTQADTTATWRSGSSTPAMRGTAWRPTTLGSLSSMCCNKVSL